MSSANAARQMALIVLGPAVAGACIGFRFGLDAILTRAISFPAILLGVAITMVPALYIGAALTGIAPSAREVLDAMRESLASTSVIFLGLAPSLAFLVATANATTTIMILTFAVITLGVLLGLKNLYRGIFGTAESHGRAFPLFAAWALVSMGIGGKLFLSALVG